MSELVEQLQRRIAQLERTVAEMYPHLFKYEDAWDVPDPPVAPDVQTVVTDVSINVDSLQFLKKTRTVVGKFTGSESVWTNWHQGTTCNTSTTGNAEALSGENVSAAATTLALLRLTRAI